jgi:hypothetical protein
MLAMVREGDGSGGCHVLLHVALIMRRRASVMNAAEGAYDSAQGSRNERLIKPAPGFPRRYWIRGNRVLPPPSLDPCGSGFISQNKWLRRRPFRACMPSWQLRTNRADMCTAFNLRSGARFKKARNSLRVICERRDTCWRHNPRSNVVLRINERRN